MSTWLTDWRVYEIFSVRQWCDGFTCHSPSAEPGGHSPTQPSSDRRTWATGTVTQEKTMNAELLRISLTQPHTLTMSSSALGLILSKTFPRCLIWKLRPVSASSKKNNLQIIGSKCSSNNEPSYFSGVVRGCLGNYQRQVSMYMWRHAVH